MHLLPKALCCLLLISLAAMAPCFLATAKPTLNVSLYKTNGYNLGDNIGGFFTVNTEVSDDATHVEFYVDDQLQQNDTTTPYSWPFDTNNYTLGTHTLKVVAFDASGENETKQIERNFVEYDAASIFVMIIVIVIVVSIILVSVAVYRIRKTKR